jgi:hypothetical protein
MFDNKFDHPGKSEFGKIFLDKPGKAGLSFIYTYEALLRFFEEIYLNV